MSSFLLQKTDVFRVNDVNGDVVNDVRQTAADAALEYGWISIVQFHLIQ